jgi:hypothetical protein
MKISISWWRNADSRTYRDSCSELSYCLGILPSCLWLTPWYGIHYIITTRMKWLICWIFYQRSGCRDRPRTRKSARKRKGRKFKKVGFEVFTAVVRKSCIFWYITSCSPLKVNWRFGGTCRHHLQGRTVSQARNRCGGRWKAKLWFLAWLILRPWNWMRHILPKHRLIFNRLYGAVSQKICSFTYSPENIVVRNPFWKHSVIYSENVK